MRSHCVQVGPKFSALLRRPCDDRRRVSAAATSRGAPGPPGVAGGQDGSPRQPCGRLDFRLRASRTVRANISRFKPPSLVMSSRSPRKPHGAWAQEPGRREYRTGAVRPPAAPRAESHSRGRGCSPHPGASVTALVGSKALQGRAACGCSCYNVKTTTLCQTAVRPPAWGKGAGGTAHTLGPGRTQPTEVGAQFTLGASGRSAAKYGFDLGKSLWMGVRGGGW